MNDSNRSMVRLNGIKELYVSLLKEYEVLDDTIQELFEAIDSKLLTDISERAKVLVSLNINAFWLRAELNTIVKRKRWLNLLLIYSVMRTTVVENFDIKNCSEDAFIRIIDDINLFYTMFIDSSDFGFKKHITISSIDTYEVNQTAVGLFQKFDISNIADKDDDVINLMLEVYIYVIVASYSLLMTATSGPIATSIEYSIHRINEDIRYSVPNLLIIFLGKELAYNEDQIVSQYDRYYEVYNEIYENKKYSEVSLHGLQALLTDVESKISNTKKYDYEEISRYIEGCANQIMRNNFTNSVSA